MFDAGTLSITIYDLSHHIYITGFMFKARRPPQIGGFLAFLVFVIPCAAAIKKEGFCPLFS